MGNFGDGAWRYGRNGVVVGTLGVWLICKNTSSDLVITRMRIGRLRIINRDEGKGGSSARVASTHSTFFVPQRRIFLPESEMLLNPRFRRNRVPLFLNEYEESQNVSLLL
jgi:hypothetical protein